MVKHHLTQLSMPRTWPFKRKGSKFTIRPRGSHPLNSSIPVGMILRDMLKYTKTAKETKVILNAGGLLVNKKTIKDPKLGLGLMDVIEFPKLKEQYRVLFNKQGKFIMHPIEAKEAGIRPYKIVNKTILKGKKVQLNLSGGANIIAGDNKYKAGDTLIFDTEKKIIKEHIALTKGAKVYITAGSKVSTMGSVDSIKHAKGTQEDNILLMVDGKHVETRKKYAFLIGKEKPAISLPK